jgi:hypothetical protein
MAFRFGRFYKSRSRLFADLVKTLYSSGTEEKTVEQTTEIRETTNKSSIDTANTDAMSAATYYINANDGINSHFTTISVVLSNDKSVANFTEYATVKSDVSLAHYDFAISDGNLELKATPSIEGVTFKVTRILVE